jgi:hypothetical protein
VNSKRNATWSLDEALQVLMVLEEVVVSLDRIGSSSSDEQETARRAQQYLGKGGAWRRLSIARRILTEALDREFTMEEIDHLIGDVPYWDSDR